ncbi:autonomous transposable element EN-1 mosaic protein [Lactuca sativa]|uniref:autonomous transposable element EN-1 mosaic protein n=1 Tax=Lactuca sativa TaxID=4236 RepID=UPI0022AFEDA2|nr:autonomous transposable element EN-1 mosaic protein [Lactuca sativa]
MSTPDTPVMPHTPLTPHGSASRDISGDHGSNDGDFDDSSLPIIHKEGDKFGDHSIHNAVIDLFWQSMDDAWPTYKSITEKTRKQMWYTTENEAIYTTFNNVLKERYKDRMRDLRKLSARMARRDGLPFKKDFSKYFPEIYQYRPQMRWSTEKWKKLSDAAQTNRNTPDSTGKTSRHTAGSIAHAKHRRRLKAQLGKDPEFCDLYVKTHGTSESKKRYFKGESENIEYCSKTAKDAKDAYLEGLVMKYGEDPANHRHDAQVWVESQIRRTGGKKKGHIYGIGALDANVVVSRITSSESTRSTQSNNNTQEEVDRLREEVSNMRQLQEQMVQQMERMVRMMNGTTNQANDPPHTPPEDGV